MMESINVAVDDQETDVPDDVETFLNDALAEPSNKSSESESTQVGLRGNCCVLGSCMDLRESTSTCVS